MSHARSPGIAALVVAHRPPSGPTHEAHVLGKVAQRWRTTLARIVKEVDAEAITLRTGEMAELAVAMTELAEDLHTNSGLWCALETHNRATFGTPLPLIWRAGDSLLAPFDARRFQFFLHSVWRHFKSDRIVSPGHRGFVAIARQAEAFFSAAFVALPRASSVTAFLGTANTRGWEVKRKLVWLGTHGFLFRFAFADYFERNSPSETDTIGATDDFLCQECTAWSGWGALDLLAAVLDLSETDRTTLRNWHERHAAFYRVDALHARGAEVETMSVTNLINDQLYSVRMEMPRARFPFAEGQMVFGSLVPWRGEWYWSGRQKLYPAVPPDFATIKRTMIESSSSIVYRYRPDLADRARQSAAEHYTNFVQFHGSDLAVFADGLAAAAAEQRHLRERIETKMGSDTPAYLAKQGLDRHGPKMSWPKKLIECQRGVAVFYHEGEGVEIMADFDVLRAALAKSRETLLDDEAETLQGFIESAAISPSFVRRVIRQHGRVGIAALYYLPTGDDAELEYLLRRFKGFYYRRRFPNISLLGAT